MWCAVSGTASVIVAFSIFESFRLSMSAAAILVVAIFVAALIGKYQIPIPGTGAVFHPKTVFAFWGIAWLGVFGGVLLAAGASAIDHGSFRKSPREWFAGVSKDVVATFAAGAAFYSLLAYFKGHSAVVALESFAIPNEIIFASVLMAITHFLTSATLDLLELKFRGRTLNWRAFDQTVITRTASYAVGLFSAIALFLTFNHFGIEFGIVIVPLAVAANIAYRMHTLSLEQKTRQITEASRIHMATVEALATAIDARDQVGVGHVRRTQIYAVGMGNVLGLNSEKIDALRTGALLHDIGKLAVPDHILNKPGRLTPAETEKTKIHSSVGASILDKVGFTTPVVPTVKYHHERWDGSGYPEGLRGSHIPLTARILSIADAYDTLRGARPYRPAVSREDACSFLRAGSGTQFDPKMVDVFLRNLKSFEEQILVEGLQYEFEPDSLIHETSNPNFVEQIKRANREVFTLYSLAREFSSAQDLEETLGLFTEKIASFVPYDCCVVYLLDETNQFATAMHVAGRHAPALLGRRVNFGDGPTGHVLKNCVSVENVDPAFDSVMAREGERPYKRMVSRPLMAEDRVIGAVSLYSCNERPYQDEHFRLLETVSRIAADAISKSLQHAEAETNAMTDPMTGLPNARSLQIEFEKEVKRSLRNGTRFQILMLDLDGFKLVNDTYGHKAGDRMLTAVGGVIREQLRDYDFLSRYAGDEFVALIPETDNRSVMELCRRIETSVNEFELRVAADTTARVGISVGAASYPAHGESFDQLIIAADEAMYQAKALHKQRRSRLEERKGYVVSEAGVEVLDQLPTELLVEIDETHIVSSASVN